LCDIILCMQLEKFSYSCDMIHHITTVIIVYFFNERRKNRTLQAFFLQKGDQKPWNHCVKLVAPSVQPGCNPRPTIISLEVVAPTCIRTRCTWSCAIVRGTSFGGIHVACELRSRCATDRTKKTMEHRLLHSLLFFASRPQNSAKRISLKCIRYARHGFFYLRWKLRCEKINDFKSTEIKEQTCLWDWQD